MKLKHKVTLAAGSFALVALFASFLSAQGARGRETVTGEVVDLFGYVSEGRHGAEFAEAGKYRVENGFPVGIVNLENGAIYVAVFRDPSPASALETANGVLVDLVGKEVVAQGKVSEKHGLKLIELAVVSEM